MTTWVAPADSAGSAAATLAANSHEVLGPAATVSLQEVAPAGGNAAAPDADGAADDREAGRDAEAGGVAEAAGGAEVAAPGTR